MKSALGRFSSGSRVRRFYGGSLFYGTVEGVASVGPWVRVLWDKMIPGLSENQMAGELQNADAPLPKENATQAPF